MSATGVWRQLGQYLGFLPKDVIGGSTIEKRLLKGRGGLHFNFQVAPVHQEFAADGTLDVLPVGYSPSAIPFIEVSEASDSSWFQNQPQP